MPDDHISDALRRITITEFEMLNTSTPPPTFKKGTTRKTVLDQFKKKVKVDNLKNLNNNPFDLEFDLIGVDPSLANAFRRALLSEVPSMAIEKVFIYNNTSIIQDEVLSHRLGLIPLKADPRLYEYKKPKPKESDDRDEQMMIDAQGSPNDTLEFELKVKCKHNPNAPTDSDNPDDMYIDHKVYTKSIKWIPREGQTDPVGPVDDDILIAKLRPGHEMDLKLYAVKGLGSDHAKFSPVCTAFYRLLPEVSLKKEVKGEAAKRLQNCFSPGVIAIGKDGKAKVASARYDACSRNVFRHDDLRDAVGMSKVRDHFIFNIESVGAVLPQQLFSQAIDVIIGKCDTFLAELDNTED